MSTGQIRVLYIDGQKHPWYQKACVLCDKWVSTQRAAVGMSLDDSEPVTGPPDVIMHKSCLEELLARSPDDLTTEKVERIVEEEKADESGLLAWVLSNDDE